MEQAAIRPVTYGELCRYPDDGIRRELLDGEVIEMPTPPVHHQTIVGRLSIALHKVVATHNLGAVFIGPLDVFFSPYSVPEPDIVFVSHANRGIVRRPNLHGAPDLCIEVISPSSKRRDRVRKAALYARYRVAEYWIVDPDAQTIEMFGLPEPPPPRRRLATYVPLDGSRIFADLALGREALFAPAFPS